MGALSVGRTGDTLESLVAAGPCTSLSLSIGVLAGRRAGRLYSV